MLNRYAIANLSSPENSRNWRNYAFFVILSFLIVFLIVISRELYLGTFNGFTKAFWKEILRNYCCMVVIWAGSRVIFIAVHRVLPFEMSHPLAIFTQICCNIAYTMAMMWVYINYLQGVIDDNIYNKERNYILTVVLIAINSAINFGIEMGRIITQWKRSIIETERLSKANMAAKLDALQSQVNPHFLFNSLNTLSSLVYKDAEKADSFIQQLSKVYRSILETREKNVVLLSEELESIKAYFNLLKFRFKDGLLVQNQLSATLANNILIAPHTLQILVENSVKHNIVDPKKPLTVQLYVENGYIVVRNNLQLRRSVEYSTHSGLDNILNRYRLLLKKDIIIAADAGYYTVKIPVILVNHESSYH